MKQFQYGNWKNAILIPVVPLRPNTASLHELISMHYMLQDVLFENKGVVIIYSRGGRGSGNGAQNFSDSWRGTKLCLFGRERFKCQLFSDFHLPLPLTINSDRSLNVSSLISYLSFIFKVDSQNKLNFEKLAC